VGLLNFLLTCKKSEAYLNPCFKTKSPSNLIWKFSRQLVVFIRSILLSQSSIQFWALAIAAAHKGQRGHLRLARSNSSRRLWSYVNYYWSSRVQCDSLCTLLTLHILCVTRFVFKDILVGPYLCVPQRAKLRNVSFNRFVRNY